MKLTSFAAFIVCLFSFFSGFSQTPVSPPPIDIGFEERQGQYVDLGTRLINEKGDTVTLKDLVNKPTILSLVYYRCPGTCSPLMWGISKVIEQVDLNFGKDYQVLTVSFDPTEDISLAIQKKDNYLKNMQKPELGKDWLFFVGDSLNIAKLTQSVGFHYKRIAGQYTHPTGLVALASDGKITRYLRGIEFLPFDIKITMVEAANGKIGPSINRLLAFCYSYDSKGNQYVFNVLKVSGAVITFMALVIFLILVFAKRKPKHA